VNPVPTIANISTQTMLGLCATRGIDTTTLLLDSQIARKLVDRPGQQIGFDRVLKLWALARERTDDEGLALTAARLVPFGAYRTLDYLGVTSATAREGLKNAARHFRLVSGAHELVVRPRKDSVAVELHDTMRLDGVPGFYEQYILATLFLRFRFTTGVDWTPREVHLTSESPRDASIYESLFCAPVRFNQSANRLVVDRSILDASQPYADSALSEILNCHAQQMLRGLPPNLSLLDEVRQVVRFEMERGKVGLTGAARQMALSPRALQRALHSHGTSFRAVLDQVRHEKALFLLEANVVDASELTFLLRFSEPRAFYRAFRRWTGKTPHEHLRSCR
jgi:AraC-like DNA-binding protein